MMVTSLNAYGEPPAVWLRRLFLSYASRNAERSLSALNLQSYRQLVRDLDVASRLDAAAVDVLYQTTSREERRMDTAGFVESLLLLSRRLYPALGQADAFSALLERDVLPRVGERSSPPEPLDGQLAASAQLLETLAASLHSVWLGYSHRSVPSARPNSAAQAAQPRGEVGPFASDEGMPLDAFLHFCSDAGLSAVCSQAALTGAYAGSLEGTYDPFFVDSGWQPALPFEAFQRALLRVAAAGWEEHAHEDVRDEPWPRPLKAMLVRVLLHTRTRGLLERLGRERSRQRLGLPHEQLLLDGWHALLHRLQLMWAGDGSAQYLEPSEPYVPSGLELIGVRTSSSPLHKALLSSPRLLGASKAARMLSPQVSWPSSSPAGLREQLAAGGSREQLAASGSHEPHAHAEEGEDAAGEKAAKTDAAAGSSAQRAQPHRVQVALAGPPPARTAARPRPAGGASSPLSSGSAPKSPRGPAALSARACAQPYVSSPLRAPPAAPPSASSAARTPLGGPPRSAQPRRDASSPRSGSAEQLRDGQGSHGAARAAHAPPASRTAGRSPAAPRTSLRALPFERLAVSSPRTSPGRSPERSGTAEPVAHWTSPRAATYSTEPWGPQAAWTAAPPGKPAHERDGRPPTTAEALVASSSGSYSVASLRQAQLAARHGAQWGFGPVESRLHGAQVGTERRAEVRAGELGGDLSSPSMPRTPKQWIALDVAHTSQP